MTFGAAAEHMGISRLTLRDGVVRKLIPARCRNYVNLRVDVSAPGPEARRELYAGCISGSDLLGMTADRSHRQPEHVRRAAGADLAKDAGTDTETTDQIDIRYKGQGMKLRWTRPKSLIQN